jgi:CRP/FNR family cyclic AMP-dependent transcriptional regulator
MVSSQLLRQFPAFTRALERSVRAIAVISHEVKLKVGETVFSEGQQADHVYLVLEGEVDVTFALNHGQVTIDTLMPGDMVCWSAIIEPFVSNASAVARSDVRLIAIDGHEMRRLFERDNSLAYYVMKEIVSCLTHRLKAAHIQLAGLLA